MMKARSRRNSDMRREAKGLLEERKLEKSRSRDRSDSYRYMGGAAE